MEYFTETADSYSECLKKIQQKYGERARVLDKREIRIGGILGFFSRSGVEMHGIVYNELPRTSPPLRMPANFEDAKKQVIAAANGVTGNKSDPALQTLIAEVRDLKDKIVSGPVPSAGETHPTISRLEDILSKNDFTASYCKNIIGKVRQEFSLEQLEEFGLVQDKVIEWIGQSIKLYQENGFQNKPRIMALVGPTGVGKTTTIAKLAANFSYGNTADKSYSVRMITIDNYRIGAEKQIETLGALMEIPVFPAKNYQELRNIIASNTEEVDILLIDTIGKSPNATIELAEMKELLEACGSTAEFHLTMAATTKASDVLEILQQFEPFGYKSVIITKLDETKHVGNMISALTDKGKSVSYITNGQKVPVDIQKADVIQFLINLEGFRIDRIKIEQLFPNGVI